MIFEYLQNWRQRRTALRELRAIDHLQEQALTLSDTHPLIWARTAARLGDVDEARLQWRKACEFYPKFVREWPDSLQILLDIKDFEEAEDFARDALKQAPRNAVYAENLAKVAHAQAHFDEALKRWTSVRRQFPARPLAYSEGAECLARVGKLRRAESLMRRAARLFPDNLGCAIQFGRVADYRQDWPAAIERWERVAQEFRHVAGDIGVARAYQETGRLEEADRYLREAMVRNPLTVELAIAFADVATTRGDKAEAVRRWARVRSAFPKMQFGYSGGVRVLLEIGDRDGAVAVAQQAIEQFPNADWALSIWSQANQFSGCS